MRVLVVSAYEADAMGADTTAFVASILKQDGHEVSELDVVGEFSGYLSEAEHRAYDEPEPLLAEDTRRWAEQVQAAEALVFCYPTTLFSVPAILKAWLERVFVPGVAFVFDEKQRVRPGLAGVRRLAVVTTTPHRPGRTRQARDLGRRTILWTLRLNCSRLCRRTFVSLPVGVPVASRRDLLNRRLTGW